MRDLEEAIVGTYEYGTVLGLAVLVLVAGQLVVFPMLSFKCW